MAHTVEIPGGEAVMYDSASELTPRRRRPVEIISARIGKKVEEVAKATRLLCDGDVVLDHTEVKDEQGEPKFTGGDVHVDERQLALIMRLNDVLAFALLKSWTIDWPLPTNEVEFMDIPIDVYDALRGDAAKTNAEMAEQGDGFTVDSVEDQESPTGG